MCRGCAAENRLAYRMKNKLRRGDGMPLAVGGAGCVRGFLLFWHVPATHRIGPPVAARMRAYVPRQQESRVVCCINISFPGLHPLRVRNEAKNCVRGWPLARCRRPPAAPKSPPTPVRARRGMRVSSTTGKAFGPVQQPSQAAHCRTPQLNQFVYWYVTLLFAWPHTLQGTAQGVAAGQKLVSSSAACLCLYLYSGSLQTNKSIIQHVIEETTFIKRGPAAPSAAPSPRGPLRHRSRPASQQSK